MAIPGRSTEEGGPSSKPHSLAARAGARTYRRRGCTRGSSYCLAAGSSSNSSALSARNGLAMFSATTSRIAFKCNSTVD